MIELYEALTVAGFAGMAAPFLAVTYYIAFYS